MLSINPIDRWPSSRITVKMLTGAPWSVVCSRAAAYVCRSEWRVTALSIPAVRRACDKLPRMSLSMPPLALGKSNPSALPHRFTYAPSTRWRSGHRGTLRACRSCFKSRQTF